MAYTKLVKLFLPILAVCLVTLLPMPNVSGNAPPDPKFLIVAESKRISDKGEIEIDKDDWILFDATPSRDADGKITYYHWTIKNEDGDYYVDEDGRVFNRFDTGEASLKVRFNKEGKYDVILIVGDDGGEEGDQKTATFKQTIMIKEKGRDVQMTFTVLILVVAAVSAGVAANHHFIRGVLLTKRVEKKRKKRAVRKKVPAAARRRVAAPSPATHASEESFMPPKVGINLEPYREKMKNWEGMNIDVSPLIQVMSDAEKGEINEEVIREQFASFEKLVNDMNNIKLAVNRWAGEIKGFDEEIRRIMTFNEPIKLNELRQMAKELKERIEEEKRKEKEIGFEIKYCAKCHAEMKVPKIRPVEVACEKCGQRHIYKGKKKK
ncbi:MAG TPA: hypothetical protein EYP29_06095 [Thermoplasmata archaeon]|nr:hypothetical protein [Thermoplasmata archaeon]